jgi:putative DNA methylase
MTPKKKLIEVALPLDAINAASAWEKSIRHGHPSTLHLWWARRPLAAARAVIFAQMMDDPSSNPERFPTEEAQEKERQRLFRLIEQLVLWENTTNEHVLAQAREEIWKSWRATCAENKTHPRANDLFDPERLPAFHDPFAGGGALPLEAQRLGLESYASDLNPVAVLICKAMIEIPPKFAGLPPINPEMRKDRTLLKKEWRGGQGLAEDVRYYGLWIRDEAEKRIGYLYPKVEVTVELAQERPDLKPYVGRKLTVIAWLWARTVKSPNPAFAQVDVPLASTFILSTKAGREAYVNPVIKNGSYRFAVSVGKPKDAEAVKNGTKLSRGAHFQCLMSGTPIGGDYIKTEAMAGRMDARMMAIVAEGERGRVYLPPTKQMEEVALTAKPDWKPEGAMVEDARAFTPYLYGLGQWAAIFTPRQLVALATFSDLVQEARERVKRDAVAVGLHDDDRSLIEDRRVKLGCVMPGEPPPVFGDALRRLAAAATYLYQEGPRYWYSTQPTVTKLAEDRAEQLKRDPDKVAKELENRLRSDLRKMGDFSRVHPVPGSSADVPDDLDARLVVLGIEHTYSKDADNAAEAVSKAIFETRGNAPRIYRNSIVFLAADKTRLQDLDEAARKFLAWESILDEADKLDLTRQQVRQAEEQKTAADGAVTARLPETYQWLLVPTRENPQGPAMWQTIRLSGNNGLAERASKKLRNDELLVVNLAATRLRMEMDRVPLWRGNHVGIRQLVEDFGRYLYLPRLQSTNVLVDAIRSGLALLTWEQGGFAYAEGYDESASRYRGLRYGVQIPLTADDSGLLVRPEVARLQIDREITPPGPTIPGLGPVKPSEGTKPISQPSGQIQPAKPKRYHGSVILDSTRVGRDAGRIADEVITHLVGLVGSSVRVTLEIEADIPQGAPDNVVRIVTENSRTLKFASNSGFETE